jgi:hypothetical protein
MLTNIDLDVVDCVQHNGTKEFEKPINCKPYMELVGALLYASISTRIDITSAVRVLTKHTLQPYDKHWVAAKHVLRYLQGTTELGLTFTGTVGTEMVITCYTDSDWATDKKDRHSITGWIVKLNGDVISYSSKKQANIALSSCEAELYAEASGIQEVLWLKHLLSEMGLTVKLNTVVYCDNQSAIAVAENGLVTERTKHIDIRYKYVKECIDQHVISTKWISTNEQQADILTKQLATPQFIKFRNLLMSE